MKRTFLNDIGASTFQVILNQALGLVIFIITSRYLAKEIYGEFNWSFAVLTFVTTILTLRLEQIIVRKVAVGDDPSKMLSLFTGHVIFFGTVFYLLLFLTSVAFPRFFMRHDLLLIIAISQLLILFSSPFKQLANGKGAFGLLMVMYSVSNLLRAGALIILALFSTITVQAVLIIYIFSALIELLTGIFIAKVRLKTTVSFRYSIKDYFNLLNESLPQMGAVFLNACIARLDWILLGIFSTNIITAEYSFAYKVFELCPLPMLILGPILLSNFSRYFQTRNEENLLERKKELGLFIRYAMVSATLLPLLLNILWAPMVDALTGNKYGEVNKINFFLLSLCIPFQYMINLLWTIQFAQNRLKLIFRITAVTCVIILVGDLVMIPLLNARGAAIVYLTATAVEFFLYLRSSALVKLNDSWRPLLICVTLALASGFLVVNMDCSLFLKLALGISIYLGSLLLCGQFKRGDLQILKEWI